MNNPKLCANCGTHIMVGINGWVHAGTHSLNCTGATPKADTKRCVCGAPIEDMMAVGNADLAPEDQVHHWIHSPGSDTRCLDARPDRQDGANREAREALSADMQKMHSALNNAEGRMHDMARTVAEATKALNGLGRALDAVRHERRATLNQVWDKLIEQGDMVGANIVRNMVKAHNRGDWS